MEFICNLRVPRTDKSFGIPTAWLHDRAVSLSAGGLLWTLLCDAEPGQVITERDLPGADHPDNPPIGDVVAELEQAGYLAPLGEGRYELVHPTRLSGLTGGCGLIQLRPRAMAGPAVRE